MAAIVVCRSSAQAPAIHSANHVDREKRVVWVSIMPACWSFPIVMVLRYHTSFEQNLIPHKLNATELLSSFRSTVKL